LLLTLQECIVFDIASRKKQIAIASSGMGSQSNRKGRTSGKLCFLMMYELV